jgi:Arc/MetJ family transcription regulator
MTETVVTTGSDSEIDAELLSEAQRQISAASPNAAINEALRRLVEHERAKRRRAMERTQQMVDEGHLDLSRLDDIDE